LKVPFRTAAVIAMAAGLALPAAAQAKTKTVRMGPPAATDKTLQKAGVFANAFFPGTTTINVGDSVKFEAGGFHSVDIPNKGGAKMLPLFVPSGQKVANSLDAAGAPFWFNGQDALGLNPELFVSNFGKKLTYDGSNRIESGAPAGDGPPKPMTVKFTKAGTYAYYCDIHPGMKGTVKVLKKGAKVPTAKQDKAALKKQAAAALKDAKTLAGVKQPDNTVALGVAGKKGNELLAMSPANLTVAPGTTVKFQMSKGSYEAHTATFGPGDAEREPQSYLGAIAATFAGPAPDARAVYPSEPPGTMASLSPSLHGNGFWNSGALDKDGASPLPDSASVTFDTPGTYTYFCMIHPFMRGTVTVQ
jgi:plastocyanin